MMQYFLLVLTSGIWGTAIYKGYRAYSGSGGINYDEDKNVVHANEFIQQDTFSISANYPDPFLGPAVPEKKISDQVPAPVRSKIKEIPKEIPLPKMKYEGTIRNQQTGKLLAILLLDGKSYMLKQGDMIGGLKLGRITKDSVEILSGKEGKFIRK